MRALGLNVELLNSEVQAVEPPAEEQPRPQLPPAAAE
jgi:hypothetical protein